MIGKSVIALRQAVSESFRAIGDNFVVFSSQETLHYDRKIKTYILSYRITDTGGLVE